MRADEVLVDLLQHDLGLPPDHHVELIRHGVGLNWRQRHTTPRQQIQALDLALVHEGPFAGERLPVGELQATLKARLAAGRDALSVTSRVWNARGDQVGHLALMNLHPVGFRSVRDLRTAIDRVTGGLPGYLLSSGRYYHFYGTRLLPTESWPLFLAQFLMPCVLVSPRYIGHSLHRGFCSLRLNAVPPVKPMAPVVSVD